MKRDPTATLVNLSKNREENALKQFSSLLRLCGSEEEKLALLERYRGEYAARLAEQGRQGTSVMALENFKQFMAHLESAVSQQQDQASRSRDALDNGLALLRQAQQRSKIFETLLEKRRGLARALEGRRQRAQEDEFAARQFATVSHAGKSSK